MAHAAKAAQAEIKEETSSPALLARGPWVVPVAMTYADSGRTLPEADPLEGVLDEIFELMCSEEVLDEVPPDMHTIKRMCGYKPVVTAIDQIRERRYLRRVVEGIETDLTDPELAYKRCEPLHLSLA